MQKAFDQSKEALQNLPADQKEAACKVSLDALNGKVPTDAAASAEDAKEAASEAAEEAKLSHEKIASLTIEHSYEYERCKFNHRVLKSTSRGYHFRLSRRCHHADL